MMEKADGLSVCLLIILSGLVFYGFHLYFSPTSVAPESLLYRWIYYWFVALSHKEAQEPPRVSERQIKVFGAIIGILGAIGILLMLW